jgi:hypothetical protein
MDEIENAKYTLEKHGYFVKNLWHIDDVLNNDSLGSLECSQDEAQDILYKALTSDYIFEQIWMAIDWEIYYKTTNQTT